MKALAFARMAYLRSALLRWQRVHRPRTAAVGCRRRLDIER